MATKYKLTYFDIRGRAEMTRMLFAAADVNFEDCRVKFADWPAMKPKTPQGALPLLEIEGKILLCQSLTIARYVARKFDLYGKNNEEAASIDMILDTFTDLNNFGLKFGGPWFRVEDPKKQAEEKAKFMAEDGAPKFLRYTENTIKTFGSNGFSASDSLSIADIVIYTHIEYWRLKEELGSYPRLAAVLQRVEENPKIAKYLQDRPERPF